MASEKGTIEGITDGLVDHAQGAVKGFLVLAGVAIGAGIAYLVAGGALDLVVKAGQALAALAGMFL